MLAAALRRRRALGICWGRRQVFQVAKQSSPLQRAKQRGNRAPLELLRSLRGVRGPRAAHRGSWMNAWRPVMAGSMPTVTEPAPADAEGRGSKPIVSSHRMQVRDVELHWTAQGAGRPLVVLHGLADSHQSWRSVSAQLSHRFRVYALDLPGCGLSGRPDASYCLDYHARLTAAWLDRMGLRSVDVVGHSYGGGVALWLLLYRASAIRRLALVAPGGLGKDVSVLLRLATVFGGLEAGAELLMPPIMRCLVRLCGQGLSAEDQHAICQLSRHPGTARAFVRTLRDVIDWRGQRRQLMHRIHEVDELPAFALFWGEQDRVIPMRHGLELCEQLDNCSFWQLPGAGHFLQWEAPNELAAALHEYLDARDLERAVWGQRRCAGHRSALEEGSSSETRRR